MISFTGSTAVGKMLVRHGADTMKRTFLELGGKSALIVLDEANPARVIPGAVGVCVHAGQACASTTRMLIHGSLFDEAVVNVTATFQMVRHRRLPAVSGNQDDRLPRAVGGQLADDVEGDRQSGR